MSDHIFKNGEAYRISFEDLVLFPLFAVLLFMSLRICFLKIKDRIGGHSKTRCPNKDCIRCRGRSDNGGLLAKLDQYKKINSLNEEVLRRIRASIVQSADKKEFLANLQQQPTVLYLQDLQPAKSFHSLTGELTAFLDKNNLEVIKKELKGVLYKEYLWSQNDVPSGNWKLYYFYNQGQEQEENCRKCPATAKIITSLTSFMENSPFGNAAFSVLTPGTVIEPHYGATNARLRCHVTLQEGKNCILHVGSENLVYRENQTILFDDSFQHSVLHENYGGRDRIILLIDLWHSNVTNKEKEAINYIYC